MRRQLSRPDPYPRGEYLTKMDTQLNVYIRGHCMMKSVDGHESRKHLTREELIQLHREAKCAWQHQGEWVVSPEHVVDTHAR